MKPKLTAKQALALYGIGMAVAFGFFLLGLNWHMIGGRSEAASPAVVQTAAAPKSSISETTTRLDLYTPLPKQDSPDLSPPGSDQTLQGGGLSKTIEPVSGSPEPTPDRPDAAPAVGEALTIQVGAMNAEAEARKLMVRLEARGFSGILDMPKAGDKYYRVRVGMYETREAARRAEALLKSEGFLTYIKKIESGGQGR